MGSWAKIQFLGKGSFGTVCKAVPLIRELGDPDQDDYDDYDDGRPLITAPAIAVKSADFEFSASLQREGELLRVLSDCPGIIRCYGEDISEENGKSLYNLLLEYAPGGSLKSLMERSGGRLPESDVRRYARMILKALCYMHRNGYTHCDIKPHNILVFPYEDGSRNYVKIADFGLAKTASDGSGWDKGHNRGTLLYSSPEAAGWGSNRPPADIWALGCTILEMMTGKRPWTCKNDVDLRRKIALTKEQPRIPENISGEGKDFLFKCLDRQWNTRWTAEKLLQHPFVQGELQELANETLLMSIGEDVQWVSRFSMFETSVVEDRGQEQEDEGGEMEEEKELLFCLPSFLKLHVIY